MREGWRLAVGTLTVLPVRPTAALPAGAARAAMLLAPAAVLPLGAVTALLLWVGGRTEIPSLVVGLVAVGVLALGSRALHWDGLSDVADGLTASYDGARSLAVMKTGTSGPAGTVAVVVVLGVQAAGLASLTDGFREAVVAGGAVCLSRCALWLVCATPVPPARPDGLGVVFTGTVPIPVAAVAVVVTGLLPALLVLALVIRCVRRLGGVTGDVMGAAIEICLAGMLVGLSWI